MRGIVSNKDIIEFQLRCYKESSEEERQGYYERTRNPLALREGLIKAGVLVEDRVIDIADFRSWLESFPEMEKLYKKDVAVAYIEKCLEHYLAFKYLNFSMLDLYIDIAAAGSNWSSLLNEKGYNSYSLDLIYKEGIHDRKIGANASDTKLPDDFAYALSAQCAYETFQGNADVDFIRESNRILLPGGRLAILPLYLDEDHIIISSPMVDLSSVALDEGAKRVWREDKWLEPFSRHYSPEAFCNRICSNLGRLKGKVIYFSNINVLKETYPEQSIYCYFMFYAEKPFITL